MDKDGNKRLKVTHNNELQEHARHKARVLRVLRILAMWAEQRVFERDELVWLSKL